MNKKIIPILLILVSSLSYAEVGKPKIEVPPSPKSPLSSEQLKLINSYLLPPPPFERTPPLSYQYTINVEKLSKSNLNPVMIYSSSGNGLSNNYISYSTFKTIPYISKCNSNSDSKDVVCSTDTLSFGWTYSINASINSTLLVSAKKPYDFSVSIQFADLLDLKNSENDKVQMPVYREIKMNQDFNYKGKKETYVFKSYADAVNSEGDEYIFTITIKTNK